MTRLSKTALAMAQAANIDPENLGAFLIEEAELAADIVKLKIQDFIDGDLVAGSEIRSLQGYKAHVNENGSTRVNLGGTIVNIPNYELFVEASDAHASLARPINVFEILDEGREELPYRGEGQKPYVLWSNTKGRNVPTSNPRARGAGGKFVTQFRAQPRFDRTAPARPEPRKGPGNEPHIPRSDLRGIKFFTRGPLPAVPGRNLYRRMLNAIQGEIRRRGDLPIKVTLRGE